MHVTRREFIVGCSAAIAALAGGRVGELVFANTAAAAGTSAASDEILVLVFLRGGCDGLSLVAPYSNGIYATARGSLALNSSTALDINPQNPTFDSLVGLHPNVSPLKSLYESGDMAIVH